MKIENAIKAHFRNSMLYGLVTVDDQGTPNVHPKEISERRIVIADIASPSSEDRLDRHPPHQRRNMQAANVVPSPARRSCCMRLPAKG